MVSVNLLRFIDRGLGTPLCLFLTLVRFLSRPFRNKILPAPGNILIIKLSEMGSTVLAYPAIEEIRKRVPTAKIYWLVFENNRAIIDALEISRNVKVMAVDIRSPRWLLRSGFSALATLRRENIDTTIDMDFFSRFSAILAFLICRGNRVGFHRFTNEGMNRGRLLTHEVLYSTHVHTSVAFMALVNSLFNENADKVKGRELISMRDIHPPQFSPAPTSVKAIKSKLSAAGADVDKYDLRIVLVNPNSSDLFPLRRWPLESFIALSRKLLASRDNIRIVITGTASEQQDAKVMMDAIKHPHCISLVGQTTFSELLALYTCSGLMITNDSGPAHFATLVRLPTIVLFGPETPALYSPLGNKAKCLYSGFACSPCVSVYNAKASPCKRSLCLEAISVDEVLSCASTMLAEQCPLLVAQVAGKN